MSDILVERYNSGWRVLFKRSVDQGVFVKRLRDESRLALHQAGENLFSQDRTEYPTYAYIIRRADRSPLRPDDRDYIDNLVSSIHSGNVLSQGEVNAGSPPAEAPKRLMTRTPRRAAKTSPPAPSTPLKNSDAGAPEAEVFTSAQPNLHREFDRLFERISQLEASISKSFDDVSAESRRHGQSQIEAKAKELAKSFAEDDRAALDDLLEEQATVLRNRDREIERLQLERDRFAQRVLELETIVSEKSFDLDSNIAERDGELPELIEVLLRVSCQAPFWKMLTERLAPNKVSARKLALAIKKISTGTKPTRTINRGDAKPFHEFHCDLDSRGSPGRLYYYLSDSRPVLLGFGIDKSMQDRDIKAIIAEQGP